MTAHCASCGRDRGSACDRFRTAWPLRRCRRPMLHRLRCSARPRLRPLPVHGGDASPAKRHRLPTTGSARTAWRTQDVRHRPQPNPAPVRRTRSARSCAWQRRGCKARCAGLRRRNPRRRPRPAVCRACRRSARMWRARRRTSLQAHCRRKAVHRRTTTRHCRHRAATDGCPSRRRWDPRASA